MFFLLGFIVVIYGINGQLNDGSSTCSTQMSGNNPDWSVTFNMCSLELKTQPNYYIVKDARYDDNPDDNYRYYINYGASVKEYPPTCENITAYYKDGNDMKPIEGLVGAYQVLFDADDNPVDGSCLPLTHGNTAITPFIWSVPGTEISFSSLAFGGIYNWWDGQYNSETDTNAAFVTIFECDYENQNNIPDSEIVYYQIDTDIYVLILQSQVGCPTDCVKNQATDAICSGYDQGRCGMDFETGKARCYCLDGYTGSDCSQTDIPSAEPIQKATQPTSDAVNYTLESGQFVLFDPHELILDTGAYEIKDQNTGVRLIFNLLKKINPDTTGVPSACDGLKDSYGYIYFPKTGTCESLGDVESYDVFDERAPAKGVTITYTNGTVCGDTTRSISINAYCPNQPGLGIGFPREFPTDDVFFTDSQECSVQAPVYMTPIACPFDCWEGPFTGETYSVCSQHGFCVYDTNVGYPRCMCYDGYEGSQCETAITTPAPSPGSPGSINPLVIIISANIAVIILIIFAFSYLYTKWKQRMYLQINDGKLQQNFVGSDFPSDTDTSDMDDRIESDKLLKLKKKQKSPAKDIL